MFTQANSHTNKTDAESRDSQLREMLNYVSLNSPFYKDVFQRNKIDISKIKTVGELAQLPFTCKDDLQLRNWDFLCVERNRIAEYCTTSGTMGVPVTIAMTENDLERLARNEHKSFLNVGADSNDIFQFMLTLDRQFMAGIAYYSGVRKLRAGLVRVGPGNAAMQLDSMERFRPSILIAVPSFLISVLKAAKERSFDLNKSSVKKIICIGENIRNEDFTLNALGSRIVENWDVQLFSTYASTEMQTAFTECSAGMGGHHFPDLIIYEVLDEQDRPVKPGVPGELVITTLGLEAMPLVRFRTGDICSYHISPCSCGNPSSRLSPVLGRKQQMIKTSGTTVYPQNIFNVLNAQEEIEDYVVLLKKNELGTDELEIVVSASGTSHGDKISRHLQSALRISPKIRYATLGDVHQLQMKGAGRKANKLIDERES